MASEAEKLRAQGLNVETVGDILNGEAGSPPTPTRFDPPRLEGTPPFPQPGIYFGMSDEDYHAIPALSCSGIKALAASPMFFWVRSWLNPEKEEQEDKEHQTLGKAYHCRILEGSAAFDHRYCVGLDRKEYPDCLESTDEIKAAILKAGEKPVTRVETGDFAPDPKTGEPKALTRAAKKEDWIAQLLEVEPNAQIWAVIQEEFSHLNGGKTFISADAYKRLSIAAAMIEGDDELSKAFSGGHPEVALFWYCPKTGVPMKCKVDYLKIRMMVDLKTFANKFDMNPERAIAREIANHKYNLQPSVYFEGADVVRQLVREHGASVIHTCGLTEEMTLEDQERHYQHVQWAMKWAQHRERDEWLWVFQQKGLAPVTRGLFYPRGGTTKMLSDDIVSIQKKRFRKFAETYGTDPWLDLAPIYDIADEDIPQYSTEI